MQGSALQPQLLQQPGTDPAQPWRSKHSLAPLLSATLTLDQA